MGRYAEGDGWMGLSGGCCSGGIVVLALGAEVTGVPGCGVWGLLLWPYNEGNWAPLWRGGSVGSWFWAPLYCCWPRGGYCESPGWRKRSLSMMWCWAG